jgi:hypothetical protein
LNTQAFFAYIGPWPEGGYIWRHVLRNTIDSLLQVPAGQAESQLLLWLKALVKPKQLDLSRWVWGKRKTFIQDLRAAYPTGIYNANEFFGVLYDLTNPDLFLTACDWLRGDDLDDDSLASLRVKQAIDSEDAAQKILSNIGKIAHATQPIVLCFDNLDNIPKLPSGGPDLQSLFNVNTTFHNEKLKNFLIIISIITNTLKSHLNTVQPADRARVDKCLQLHPIPLEQAASLWVYRLRPLHQKLVEPPASSIAPLSQAWLDTKFPRGKALPRNVLILGQQLIDRYKQTGALPTPQLPASLAATPAPAAAIPESSSPGFVHAANVTSLPAPLPATQAHSAPEAVPEAAAQAARPTKTTAPSPKRQAANRPQQR